MLESSPMNRGASIDTPLASRLSRDTNFLDRIAVDALSDILKAVRLEGAVYLDAEFTAPWCALATHGLEAIRERLPSAEHVICFHFIAAGGCKVRLGDGRDAFVMAGDLILFTHEEPQLMGSDL